MKKLLLFSFFVFPLYCMAQSGIITTIAGTGTAGYSGDGAAATAANLNHPAHPVFNSAGELLFTDYYNNRIRKIDVSGNITTIVGTGSTGYSGDGAAATACELNLPNGLAIDRWGNLYISDEGNGVVRKVDTSGTITTIAGSGTVGYSGDGGPATAAQLNCIAAVSDNAGNVYIADYYNSRIRKVNTSGIISTFAGTGTSGYSGDGGMATAADINVVANLIVDNFNNVLFCDQYNHCIRKIDTSGIISTIAGNGSPGYSGDGGPATMASLYNPSDIRLDRFGNLLIDDSYNNVIRSIDPLGIITTLAGSAATGYSGDGGSALAATLHQPWGIITHPNGDLIICDAFNEVIRKVTFAPTHISDSFNIYVNMLCSGPQIRVLPNRYVGGMYIITQFGDGNSDSVLLPATGSPVINHIYANSGTFTIKQVLHRGSTVVDSFQFTYNHSLCNAFPVSFFADGNSNCVKDATEASLTQPLTVEVDSNGVAIDTLSATSGLSYVAYGAVGDIYAFKVVETPLGLRVSCPSTGIIFDTLSATALPASSKSMALECNTATGYDLKINAVVCATGVQDQYGYMYIDNTTCNSPGTTAVTLSYSRKCRFYNGTDDADPLPTSYTDSTITWNIPGPVVNNNTYSIFYRIWYNHAIGMLTIGDTLHTSYFVSPRTGDTDTSNNTVVIIDTVKAGCDPNAIYVKPGACIPSGATATQLQYTINFENTGNDTAHNIYVLDTLPNYVDATSMRIVMASHEMYTSKYKDAAGHTIMKFDFPNIKLLDSSHHGQCDGTVIYTINTRPGLALGTHIINRAGIYFDVNDVVMTNEATTTIGCEESAVHTVTTPQSISIYPNPTGDILNIDIPQGAYDNCTITNSIGAVVMNKSFTQAHNILNVKELPAGVYYVTLRGAGGVSVRKLVKG